MRRWHRFAAILLALLPLQALAIEEGLDQPYPAPEFAGIEKWIQSEPLSMQSLKGKVVLVDFWAYSCVNCVRTLPFINEWDKKYRDKGLVIVGVHAPEFDFEKSAENVQRAINKWKITYPVALDNDMKTWGNFHNQYWPAHYLIDREGNVVYTHFGEGNYELTERNIRSLLGLKDVDNTMSEPPSANMEGQTPETYLGYRRAENFKGIITRDAPTAYVTPASLPLHYWALSGEWNVQGDAITAEKADASLTLHFFSKKVFLVLGSSSNKPAHAQLMLNNKPLAKSAGKDAPDGKFSVEHYMLYELVNQPEAKEGTLTITADEPGLKAYAFTFGN